MPRIPDAEIDRIKRETDLAALVRARGVELHKHGSKDFSGKCPFHPDDQPSFIVSPEKGLFHCMGCGAAGNAIQFVERFDGVSFRHAFELLNDGKAAFSAPSVLSERVKKASVPRLDNPFEALAAEAAAPDDVSRRSRQAEPDAALMRQVVDYYHERLLKTPVALEYLRGRGLCHDEALRTFRLGLSDRTLGLRIPAMNRKEGEALRTRLQRLGIYRENGREHMNGRVVLPIPGPAGRTKLYGRLFTKPNPGTPKHLYLPGPHEGIWNADALGESELILCEAPFDALTFWVNGFKNVTFIYGTEGFLDLPKQGQSAEALREGGTDTHMGLILKNRIRRVYLAYDADEAGNRAAGRDAERLTAHGVEVFRVKFPWGMDANEYAVAAASQSRDGGMQPPGGFDKLTVNKALQTLLNAAEWLGGTVGQPSSSRVRDSAVPGRPTTPLVTVMPEACPQDTPRVAHAHAGASSSLLAAELAADEKEQPKPTPVAPPKVPTPEAVALERQGEYHVLRLGHPSAGLRAGREYRVGGLEKNNSLEVLKVAVRLRYGERST